MSQPINDVESIGSPSVVNRGIMPIAIQAGLVDVLKKEVKFGMGYEEVLYLLRDILKSAMDHMGGDASATFHPSLNQQVFGEILAGLQPGEIYRALKIDIVKKLIEIADAQVGSPIATVENLPDTAQEPGPELVSAVRADAANVNIMFTPPSPDWYFEIYINLMRAYVGSQDPEEDNLIHVTLPVPQTGNPYSVRILYSNVGLNAQGLFSLPVYII